MTEPDVTLTDYALALLCGAFAWRVQRLPPSCVRPWLTLFFVASATAPLAGGTVHGFFLDTDSLGHRILWPLTLLAIGVAAVAGWALAAVVWRGRPPARGWRILGVLAFCAYAAVVLFRSQDFAVAVAFYLPAALFLLAILCLAWLRQRRRDHGLMALGILVMLVAAAVQQLGIGLHPRYFNHNALYHLVQALGFALLFVGGLRLASAAREGIGHADAT